MNWPVLILLGFGLITLGIHLAKHEEQRDDKYNFGAQLIIYIIEAVLILWAVGWTIQ